MNKVIRPIRLIYVALTSAVALVVLAMIMNTAVPLIPYNDEGAKMTAYAGRVTASNGHSYRITVTTHYEPGRPTKRIADAYSLDSTYAGLTAFAHSDLEVYDEMRVCTRDQLKRWIPCNHGPDPTAEKILAELVKKVMTPKYVVPNFEAFWSLQLETKAFIDQIKAM